MPTLIPVDTSHVDTSRFLNLNSNGNGFHLAEHHDFANHPNLRVREAGQCRNRSDVLQFLRSIQNEPSFYDNISLMHDQYPRYPSHSRNVGFGIQMGRCHHDSIETMIQFVEQRMQEEHTVHEIFNKIGRIIGPFINKLEKAATIPILGMIPASIRIGIGCIQIVSGILLPTLFYLPSFFSENCNIICQRSSRHIFHGIRNSLIGIFQLIPFHFLL